MNNCQDPLIRPCPDHAPSLRLQRQPAKALSRRLDRGDANCLTHYATSHLYLLTGELTRFLLTRLIELVNALVAAIGEHNFFMFPPSSFRLCSGRHYFRCHESRATPVIVSSVPAILIQFMLSLRKIHESTKTSNT